MEKKNKENREEAEPAAEPEPHNHVTATTTTAAAAAYSSPPRSSHDHEPPNQSQSQPISSPLHSPPLSPLHLESRAASPPVGSPDASSISSGHTSGGHLSFQSEEEEHLPRKPPATTPSPSRSPSPPRPAVAVAKRLVRDEPKVVTEVDPGAQDGFAAAVEIEDRHRHDGGGGGESVRPRRQRPELSILRKAKRNHMAKRVLLGFRVFGFLFCLVSFSVMAADKNQGWALDSFHRYKEFRYCMAVNVMTCAYSGLQAYDVAYELATGKRISGLRFRYYADFFLDQILAYLLMSSSSSAATRVEDWQSNWGKDKFPSMAHASVGLSFTAFVALALSSLVSGYLLCTLRST